MALRFPPLLLATLVVGQVLSMLSRGTRLRRHAYSSRDPFMNFLADPLLQLDPKGVLRSEQSHHGA